MISGLAHSECTEGCLSCEADAQTNTFSCKICDTYNYYFMYPGSNVCEKFEILNCEIPSVDRLCLICNSGYMLDEVAGICVQVGGSDIKTECLRYDSNMACVECNEDHFMDGSDCVAVTSTVSNCKIYSSLTKCDICKTGYFLVEESNGNQTCQSISKKSNCWRYSLNQCDECDNNKVMNKNYFLDQINNSAVIQTNVSIVEDEILFSTQQGNLCVDLSDVNCISTDSNTGECLSCDAGYFMNSSNVCEANPCLLYTSPSPRDGLLSRMPSSA